MEVSHVSDHVTHAVIGGHETIDFGISNSAEFFNILSSTLYSNQHLAVIREVVCNAWDAHIDSGRTNMPIDITLTKDELIIRDYGKGIPHALIGQIYGTYGNSTKKNDGGQTGGFGLGSKAPFAYTDHFEVITFNGGTKTIYNMSRSSAMVGGKPGIKTIASFPTTESGVQVSIKIKDQHDYQKFLAYTNRIVMNGEMLARLNKNVMDTTPYSKAHNGFMVLAKSPIESVSEHLYIRYGNVIYPLPTHDAYRDEYNAVVEVLSELQHRYSPFIVFQAPPNSISVTPSRETLSLQDHTIQTVLRLLQTFLAKVNTESLPALENLLIESVSNVWQKQETYKLLSMDRCIPGHTMPDGGPKQVTTVPGMVRYRAAAHYPDVNGFRERDLELRIRTLIAGQYGNKGLLQAFLAAIKNPKLKNTDFEDNNLVHRWFIDYVFSPILRGMDKTEYMKPERLTVLPVVQSGHYRYVSSDDQVPVPISKWSAPYNVEELLPFMRGIVVLSFTKRDVYKRLRAFDKKLDTQDGAVLVYTPHRNQKHVDEAKAFLKQKYGIRFIDLTVPQPWESRNVVTAIDATPRPKAPPRKKLDGFPSITAIKDPLGMTSAFHMDRARRDDVPTIKNPQWFTWLPTKTRHNDSPQTLSGLSMVTTKYLVKYYGNLGAVALTKTKEKELEKLGAVSLHEFMYKTVPKKLVAAKDFWDWYHLTNLADDEDGNVQEVWAMLLEDAEFRKELGIVIPNKPTEEISGLNDIFESELNYTTMHPANYGVEAEFKELLRLRNSDYIPAGHPMRVLLGQVRKSSLLGILSIHKVRVILASSAKTKLDLKAATRSIVLTALKG